jgi:hypothetical protein
VKKMKRREETVETGRGEKREADQRVERSKMRNEKEKKNHHYFDVFILTLLKPALCKDI